MSPNPEPIFSVLAEGGSLSISRITINGQQRYLTNHKEADLTDEGLGVNQQIGYGSFEEAFGYMSNYPWHRLYLRTVHGDYRVQVLERLMEVLNGERGVDEFYKRRKLQEHQEVLLASIYQDAFGVWRYTLEDNGTSSAVKMDIEK